MSDHSTTPEYYKAIFDNSFTAIFYTIPDGSILDANPAAVAIFGYTLDEIRKMGRFPLFDHDDPAFISVLKTRGKKGVATGEVIGIRKNGERFPCEMSSVVFRDENGEERTIVSLTDITERKALEKEMFTRQELLNAVVNNSNDGIAVTNKQGHFLIFNQVMMDLLGVQPVDSKKYDWAKSFNIYQRDGSALVPTNKLPIVRALNGEKVKNEIYLVKNPKKGNVYLSISASPIRGQDGDIIGGLVVDSDVTAQLEYNEKLKKANDKLTKVMNSLVVSNERYKYAVKATNDAIWDMDLKTFGIKWGEGYEKIFGYKLEKNEGNYQDWRSKIHPDEREGVISSIEALIREKNADIWEAEYRYFKADGSIAYIYDRGYLIYDTHNKPMRMVGAMQDITARKSYETERTQLIDDLLQQNKNLEQFTYIISHNLRSPLANIIGCIAMLKDEGLTEDEMETILRALSLSTNKLDTVIKDLNIILQVKNNIGEKRENINLPEILQDVKTSLADLIIQSDAQLNVNLEATELFAIKSFVYSIFLNLVSNSLKYRRDNTPLLIDITSTENDDKVHLTFKDNGLGIDLESKGADLFGLYKRFHSHVEGKGLGLFMVKTQVEAMHGKISVKSKLNEGTEFNIEFLKG